MKILFVNRLMGIFWGGGESFDYNIAKTLLNMGHKVCILTGKPLLSPPKNAINDVEVHYISSPYLRGVSYKLGNKVPKIPTAFMILDLLLFEKRAFKWIVQHRIEFDVIQILALPRLAQKIVNELSLPVVLWFPGPPSEKWDLPIIRRLKETGIVEFFAAGDTIRFLESRGIKIHNIPQGVDYNIFAKIKSDIRSRYNISRDDILLVSCGRIIQGKGFEFLLDGFKEVSHQCPNIRLMIIGDGALKPFLEKRVNDLEIKDKVIFTDRIEHTKVSEYYSSADIFLLLSSYENFSNAVLEAMACELAVITTNVGGFPLQIKEGINGFLVNYGDTNALASKIIYLAKNPEIRHRIGHFNRQEILSCYSWRNSANKLLSIYKNLQSNIINT